jgi:hypothetical protein
MENANGFEITATENGITISINSISHLHILFGIVLKAKFPEGYKFHSETLLNPYVEQLIDAVEGRLLNDPDEKQRFDEIKRLSPYTYESSDPFIQDLTAFVDDYMKQRGIPQTERETLLRKALKPHTVEKFE